MADDNVIEVAGVSKRFRLRAAGGRTLKAAILDLVRHGGRERREFQALTDVTFSVKRGETLGVIGANGAGKSTLLALMTGTMKPTGGTITTNGKVSSLLELGAGFHPDLSGRENVFLYGAIMGLSKRQMTERFDAIVDFAELREWIDEPVKHYSSGMYVRLGFAVAVEVDPDIMLVDEVLAVGDASFQRKCLERIGEFKDRGKTMVIISHDLPTIQATSDRILFLDGGRIHGLGYPSLMVEEYQKFLRERDKAARKRVWGTKEVVITHVDLLDEKGAATSKFQRGRPLLARIRYKAEKRIADPVFGFAICDEHGRVIYGNNTQIENFHVAAIEGEGALTLRINSLEAARGSYLMSFSVHSQDHRENYYRLENALPFEVECDSNFEGCYMPCLWGKG